MSPVGGPTPIRAIGKRPWPGATDVENVTSRWRAPLPSIDGRPATPGTPTRRRARAAGRDPRRRLLDGAGRAVLHDAAGGPGRGRRQGRAARGRRDAWVGAAVDRRRRGGHPDRGLLPRRQPEQALDPARPPGRPGPGGAAPPRRRLATCWSRTSGSARSTGWASGTPPWRRSTRASSTSRSRASATTGLTPGKPGYDFVVQAAGGLMSITGALDEDGGQPTKVGVAISDIVSGLFGAVSRARGAARPCRRSARAAERAAASGSTCRCWNRRWPCSSTRHRTRSSAGRRRAGWATPTRTSSRTRRSDGGRRAGGRPSAASASGPGCARPSACPASPPTRGSRPTATGSSTAPTLRPILASRFATRPTSDWAEVLDGAGIPYGPINDIVAAFASAAGAWPAR